MLLHFSEKNMQKQPSFRQTVYAICSKIEQFASLSWTVLSLLSLSLSIIRIMHLLEDKDKETAVDNCKIIIYFNIFLTQRTGMKQRLSQCRSTGNKGTCLKKFIAIVGSASSLSLSIHQDMERKPFHTIVLHQKLSVCQGAILI